MHLRLKTTDHAYAQRLGAIGSFRSDGLGRVVNKT